MMMHFIFLKKLKMAIVSLHIVFKSQYAVSMREDYFLSVLIATYACEL